jgi:threonine dehydrogenase-like Zn-dependent dehydrogenase
MTPSTQQTLVLEDVRQFGIRRGSIPVPGDHEVIIQVRAVGICGTDLHIFHGLANYHRDARGRPIPLSLRPQILGHEFCGRVTATGRSVRSCRVGDRAVVDQFLSCISFGRSPRCEYCESGDSHQCEFGQELGITGLPGAFMEYMAVPESNVMVLPSDFEWIPGALIEPLGCVIHASHRMETSHSRYTFEGRHRIRNILILGLGPSGLLFLQYLYKVKNFDGEIFAVDLQEEKLRLAERFGATGLNADKVDLISEIERRTGGEKIHYLIEATGNASAFDYLPSLLRRQSTVLLYGAGHKGRDIECLTSFQVAEIHFVTSSGASGGWDSDGTATTYRLAMEYIRDGRINVNPIITHQYSKFSQLQQAFAEDFKQPNYIKGVMANQT